MINDMCFDVAIIGMAGRFPMANDVSQYWENLINSKDCITRNPEKNTSTYISAYGIMPNKEYFDADFFEYNNKDALYSDPQQRIILETIYQALENSGYETLSGKVNAGLFVSCEEHFYSLNCALQEKGSFLELMDLLSMNYFDRTFTNKIAYKLNLQGSSVLYKYGCASSLVTVYNAYNSLINGECDIAIAGGVSIMPENDGYSIYDATLSKTGYTRPFDANADGFVSGDAVGIVILKRLDLAEQDNDNIIAVLKGGSVNNDGNRKAGFSATSVIGQTEAILSAIDSAGLTPNDISYVETHGTATTLGDAVELRTLKNVFSKNDNIVNIGSVKSNIGHTSISAGISSIIKTALMLKNRVLVPTIHYKNPHFEIANEDCNIKVVDKITDWNSETPRNSLISAFGIGGANAILVLSEYIPSNIKNINTVNDRSNIFVLSAKTQEAVSQNCLNLCNYVEQLKNVQENFSLQDISYTLQVGRYHYKYRTSVVASNYEELSKSLRLASKKKSTYTDNNPKVVFVFAGAGSQIEGYGQDIYLNNKIFKKYFDECATVISNITGLSISLDNDIDNNSSVTMLRQIAFQYSISKTLIEFGITPNLLIGHSLGEYVSACISNVITFSDMVNLIYKRSLLLDTLPDGNMIGLGISASEVDPILTDGVNISAINGEKRITVSGLSNDMQRFYEVLKNNQIEYSVLPVNRAGHSKSVSAISEQYLEILNTINFKKATIPMISTYTCKHSEDLMATSKYWIDQMCNKVDFYGAIKNAIQKDNTLYIEISMNCQLAPQIKKLILKDKTSNAFSVSPNNISSAYDGFLICLAKCWENGINIPWDMLYATKPYRVPLPTYAFQDKYFWKYKPIKLGGNANVEVAQSVENVINDNLVLNKSEVTKTELKLCKIINNITGDENINVEDNIFEMGIDSLSAIEVLHDIERDFNYHIKLQEIYQFASIKEIALFLDANSNNRTSDTPNDNNISIEKEVSNSSVAPDISLFEDL